MLSMLSSVFLLQFLLAERSEITRKIPLQRTCRSSYTLAVLLPGIPDASPTDEQFCFVSDKICKWMFMYPGILLGYSMSIYIYILYIYISYIYTHTYIYKYIYIHSQNSLISIAVLRCVLRKHGWLRGRLRWPSLGTRSRIRTLIHLPVWRWVDGTRFPWYGTHIFHDFENHVFSSFLIILNFI